MLINKKTENEARIKKAALKTVQIIQSGN